MSDSESMTEAQRTAWLHKHCEPGCTLVYESCGVRLSVTKSANYVQPATQFADQWGGLHPNPTGECDNPCTRYDTHVCQGIKT